MSEKISVAVIYGSTRAGRFCETVARWVLRQLEGDSRFEVDIIDPGGKTLPMAPGDPIAPELMQKLERADAFIVITPEYNRSYPAALKALIDSAHREWQSKPVAFVSYGGISGGLRAVEHLRPVFAELHAVTLRDTVSFANPWQRFAPDGTMQDDSAPAEAIARQLAHLDWWARALKNARLATPYEEIAA
ncbi:NADPH-dependent FMN reductase [Chelativorans sp. YIM 93263]|uniref:NADPH-dependent FMN reductase n=1 Tax=Chelativorans sp. YIM 93263 TaxID=2906648 RepID=UPI0023780336|nr:NAD(P)H-dependent oxidoreductase [Chelativorans sp. YIM 93263]